MKLYIGHCVTGIVSICLGKMVWSFGFRTQYNSLAELSFFFKTWEFAACWQMGFINLGFCHLLANNRWNHGYRQAGRVCQPLCLHCDGWFFYWDQLVFYNHNAALPLYMMGVLFSFQNELPLVCSFNWYTSLQCCIAIVKRFHEFLIAGVIAFAAFLQLESFNCNHALLLLGILQMWYWN